MEIDLNSDEVKEAIREAVDAEVQGLKAKNQELILKLKKAKSGEDSSEEYENLLKENYELKDKLSETTKQFKKVSSEFENVSKLYQNETESAKKLVLETNLTNALTNANIDARYLDAVKALLKQNATVNEDRQVVVGDKSLSEYMTEWSASDQAKAFIKAPESSGGNSLGGKGKGSHDKTVPASEWKSLSHGRRMELAKDGYNVAEDQ